MLLAIILVVGIIVVCCYLASSGNEFRDNSQKIEEGMTKDEVVSIMGEPSFIKKHQDGSIELIYEKSEWKGWARGGTKTRRMEIVVSSTDQVISIGKNENCDKSGW